VVAEVGDKKFTLSSGRSFLVGPTGLLWVDEITPLMSYDDAAIYCQSKGAGFRLAFRTELLNTINYELDGTSDVSLLDKDFARSRAGTGKNKVETSWAAKEGSIYYQVNNFSGADVRADATAEHRVRCVKGTPAGSHTFTIDSNSSNIKDLTTKLEWTVINNDLEDVNRTYGEQSEAASFCPADFDIPTINQLRSIFSYSNSELYTGIAPDGSSLEADTYNIWSSTEYTNKSGTRAYFTMLNEQNTSIRSDEDSQTAFVTCVKDNN
jgi:hypothetical protein